MNELRNRTIGTAVTDEEYTMLNYICKQRGQNMSQFLRDAIVQTTRPTNPYTNYPMAYEKSPYPVNVNIVQNNYYDGTFYQRNY